MQGVQASQLCSEATASLVAKWSSSQLLVPGAHPGLAQVCWPEHSSDEHEEASVCEDDGEEPSDRRKAKEALQALQQDGRILRQPSQHMKLFHEGPVA